MRGSAVKRPERLAKDLMTCLRVVVAQKPIIFGKQVRNSL